MSPPPTTTPFQAPDFGESDLFLIENDLFLDEGEQASAPGVGAARRRAG
ncbi:hypothetical protein ACWD26_04935 [Streptomyces sp. NPDC002787]